MLLLLGFLALGESKKCGPGYEKKNGVCVDRNECTEEQDLFSFDSGLIPFCNFSKRIFQELAMSQESAQTRKDRTIAMSAPTALSLTRGTKKTV